MVSLQEVRSSLLTLMSLEVVEDEIDDILSGLRHRRGLPFRKRLQCCVTIRALCHESL